MGSIDSRLRRLEEQDRGGCPECGFAPDSEAGRTIAAVYPDEPGKGFEGDPHERCALCGHGLHTVLRVVRDG